MCLRLEGLVEFAVGVVAAENRPILPLTGDLQGLSCSFSCLGERAGDPIGPFKLFFGANSWGLPVAIVIGELRGGIDTCLKS